MYLACIIGAAFSLCTSNCPDMENMGNIYQFLDAKTVPDPVHLYTPNLAGVPIVIDNGSYQSRVGWATDPEPRLQFRNCYAKHRKDRGKKIPATTELLVGNDITNLEAVRFQLKTAHDENIVTHYQAQELLLDYTFSRLGLSDPVGVPHPVVMTEPFLNPNYCRGLMSELLFECYNIPTVAYCVDGLASYYNNQESSTDPALVSPILNDGLLLHVGHHTTHVIPVLDGQADAGRSRRIRIGGHSLARFLCRWLQLKYSHHASNITLSRAEELIHKRMRIAREFTDELRAWHCPDYYSAHAVTVQLPYTAAPPAPPADAAAQRERRREAARRLVQLNARKREEKLAEDESETSRLTELRDALSEFTPCQPEYCHALEEAGVATSEELDTRLASLQYRIRKAKTRLEAGEGENTPPATPVASTNTLPAPPTDPEAAAEWVATLKGEWSGIKQRRAARRSRRQEMAKRRTVASQERMRIISQLAKREKKEDNFGRRDEDWDVYKAINKEGGGSDSEEESERLGELESLLKQHSPEFLAEMGPQEQPLTLAEKYQFHLSTELVRTGELLFQPSMVGLEQGGLADTIEFVLRLFTPDEQTRLVSNVLVTGGAANLPGLIDRLEAELMAIRPFQSQFKVTLAKDPSVDAWLGCRAASADLLQRCGVTRQQYEEEGGERVARHCLGNSFWQSAPPPVPEDTKQSPPAAEEQAGTSASSDLMAP